MTATNTTARLWAAVAAALALALGLTVTLTYTGGFGDATPTAAAAEAVDVRLTEFAIEPAEITVPAGTEVSFSVTNDGAAPHDFVIQGVGETAVLDAGESERLTVGPLEPGTYTVVCNEPGHEGAGMVGTIVVTEDGAAHGQEAAHEAPMTAEEMAAVHDDLSAYPVETEGKGNQPLEPTVAADGTKVFELTAEEIEWETEPGDVRQAMAYNGQVPGPRIDVDLGDNVRIVLNNELSVPTGLHLHGLVLPNAMDGVPGLTQDSVLPGESFEYEFEVRNSGSHMYHSHFDSANQVPGGLLGAFIVQGEDEPEVDHDIVMVLNDGPLGYTINGKGFPATEPYVVQQGETIRVRYMNEGLQIHPMHLHGMPQQVIARDGYMLDSPYMEDNVLISPGDRVDVIVEATEPGAWAWHCHILTHAEGPHGMFGMVTALIVED
jgi:manganese oxidase